MVLFALIRISTKAAIVGGPIWLTYKYGVWGDTMQGQEAAVKIKQATREVLDETVPKTWPISQIKSSVLPQGISINILDKIPSVPSGDELYTQVTYGWNSFVDSSVNFLRDSPKLMLGSLKTVHGWVRSAIVTEDRR